MHSRCLCFTLVMFMIHINIYIYYITHINRFFESNIWQLWNMLATLAAVWKKNIPVHDLSELIRWRHEWPRCSSLPRPHEIHEGYFISCHEQFLSPPQKHQLKHLNDTCYNHPSTVSRCLLNDPNSNPSLFFQIRFARLKDPNLFTFC